MSFAEAHNVCQPSSSQERAADNASLTAAGAGDNTAGGRPDHRHHALQPPAVHRHPDRLEGGARREQATLTIKSVVLEHGDQSNLSDAANLSAPADVVGRHGRGSTLRGVQKYAVDLAGCKRYIRLKYTPDLSAGNTDTAECAAGFVFGGTDIAS
jgi:hypothetical protein